MESLFNFCQEIESLDLSNFDTSNVQNMKTMFNGCKSLKEIKGLNKFNTINVTDMRAMFEWCLELESLDLSNFNTSNVIYMPYMFNKCSKLKKLKGIDKLITNNTRDVSGMFYLCFD